jgi:hypothetical protein
VRVVVELRQEDFRALSEASGRAPADFLRLVALRLASLGGEAATQNALDWLSRLGLGEEEPSTSQGHP